ncbi:hypothetical protein LMG7053_05173 [Achromobacter ruhlandii]|uniref:Uncharacterized protein n=1 Tax=Achromobacter ruhlandii TaxID=72557 RepID=A0ABM8M1N2_9BURK|nr:hypothetical protein LMG7053_05173 [Achromobacter ruhlandii]
MKSNLANLLPFMGWFSYATTNWIWRKVVRLSQNGYRFAEN